MSKANPTSATEDPPPLVNGESAASDKKNSAEKYGPEDSREVAVTSNGADAVKNGTEGLADEGRNILEADDTNGSDSGCANIVGAVDVKLVDTHHESNVEAVDVKMVDTQNEANVEAEDAKMAETHHEANIEAEHMKMIDTQHEANIDKDVKMVGTLHEVNIEAEDVKMVGTQDVKMVHTQHEANSEAEEDACQDKEGKNGDNQHGMAIEGEDIKMVEAKADARNSEAQDRKEDTCQMKNHTNIEEKDMKMMDVCQKEDKEGKNGDNQHAVATEGEDIKMVEANADARDSEAQDRKEDACQMKNHTNIEEKDMKMVDKEDVCQKEDKEGKNGDNQHAMATEGEDIKMVEAKADARDSEAQDRKEDACQVKNHTNIEEKGMKMVDKEDVCQKEDKEGKNGDNQHAMATEGEDIKMVEAKADARDSEAQDRKEDMCQVKNHTNIEEKGMKMVDKEDVCQKEDKEGKNGDNQHAMATEGEDTKMVEAKADARDSEAQDRKEDACQMKNHTNIEEKGMKMVDKEDVHQKEDKEGENEDCLYAKVAEADEMKIVEAKADVRNAEVQGNGKKEEMEDKVREKKNNTNIEDDDVKTVDKEVAYEKEGEGNNEGSHDAKVAGDEIKMVVGKTDVGNAEVEENGKKEEKAEKTEEEKNNANIETKESIVLDKDDACWKEGKKVKNEDVQDAKETDGEDMEIVEGKNDARIAKVKENRKKGEMEDNAKEKENDASIEADNLTLVDKENACQNKDKEGKIDDSQDAKAAEDGEDIEMAEAKSDAGNAVVTKNGKKEEKEDQNEEKENDISNQADEVKIVDKEDAFQKEDMEKKNEDSHSAKAAEGEEITVVEAKSAAVHAEVKENGKNEEDQNKTEEKQNDNKEKSICVDKQDENKMKAVEVDKQEMDNREQVGVEKQDGSKEDEKGGVHKHEMSYGEESVKESQEVMKGEENDNVGKQEVDDREQNIKGNKEGLEEEEIVGSSKHKVAKDEQNGAAEKQEGEKQDGNVAAEKKEEEKHDARLTAEEKDKTQDGRAVAEKKEEVNKNIAFEKNAEIVIEMGVSKEDEEMETNGKTTADKQEGKQDNQIAGICKQEGQKKGTKRSNADMEVTENGSASKKEKDGEVALEEVGESDADKSMEESKYEAPKRKKARIVREDDHKKDKKKNGSKSREAKDLLNTPSPYSLDRPVRARKTVERLVEVIEKEPSGSLFVEKGRGTPLKNIPGVAKRISKKTSADLKFLHQLLFGRFGRAADFQDHILEFSGFVWHESDEKHRAKAKEKLDKCFKDTLFDLCDLLAIPVSRANSTKEDIVTKLLDFIAEPHANNDSTLSDDQGSNSRKRKREGGSAAKNHEGTLKRFRKKLDDEHTSRKSQHKYHELESDEGGAEEGPKEDEHMKSDSKENKDDSEEADSEQEDSYDSRKVKASKKSMEGKGSTAKRKAITGSVPKTAPVATLSKCSSRVSSSKGSKDKQSAEDSNSRKSKPITPKCVTNSLKEANERRSSGKGFTSKGKSAEAEKALPSKDELQNTIVGILKNVDINKKTFSDILEQLDEHYKMDLSSRKEAIKSMIYDELIKLAAADED